MPAIWEGSPDEGFTSTPKRTKRVNVHRAYQWQLPTGEHDVLL